MSAVEILAKTAILEKKDPRAALTAEGMTEPTKEDSMPYFSTPKSVDYHSYLKSVDWKRKKMEWVNSGRPTMCWACEEPMPADRSGFNFHHRTYANLGNENLDDLVLLCRTCHKNVSQEWSETKRIPGHCLHNQTHIYIVSTRIRLGLSTHSSNFIMKHLGAYHD